MLSYSLITALVSTAAFATDLEFYGLLDGPGRSSHGGPGLSDVPNFKGNHGPH